MHAVPVQKQTPDGWQLHALDVQPAGPARAVVVAGHAMMVDHRTLWRTKSPSVVGTLVAAGCRVLVADLRGHGRSGPRADAGGQWTYDDLVADTAVWRAWADELADGLPVIWLSHSLFGHTSLAWFGQHPERQPHAFVAFAVNAWGRSFEPSKSLWMLKSAMMRTTRAMVQVTGKMPAKAMRMGNHDEAQGYWLDLSRMALSSWSSRTGLDYHAGLRRVTCPILCIYSDGDRVFTRPADGERFTALLPMRDLLVLGPGCDVPTLRGLAPGHMGLVTSPTSSPIWDEAVRWLVAKISA